MREILQLWLKKQYKIIMEWEILNNLLLSDQIINSKGFIQQITQQIYSIGLLEYISLSQFVNLISLPKSSQFLTIRKRSVWRKRIIDIHLGPHCLNIILFRFSEFLQ